MVVKTGEIFNSLVFGGVNSADYGIYITGSAVFDAPKRLVNMISVPGRNGAVAIDQGHWDNITVEYPAGVFGDGIADFREAMSNFRNAICSQIGYQRLTDTYHPDEYRMALYVDGLEVNPVVHNSAGEFTLKFNCKPQRWLTSGETIRPVFNGTVLTNPTLHDAGPLLMVKGYGSIAFNGYEINLENAVYGEVELFAGGSVTQYAKIVSNYYDTAANAKVASGDLISFRDSTWRVSLGGIQLTTTMKEVHISDSDTAHFASSLDVTSGRSLVITTRISGLEDYAKGSAAKTWNNTVTITGQYRKGHTDYSSFSMSLDITVTANANYVRFSRTYDTGSYGNDIKFAMKSQTSTFGKVTAQSTMSALGNPTYIDCEIGESYSIEGGEYSSMNQYIALGSDLPTLASGDNEITFDDTITELKVKPNWWKL